MLAGDVVLKCKVINEKHLQRFGGGASIVLD